MTDMARNVVVTGAAGYIGSSLTAHLLAQGYHVTAIDHLMYGGDSLIPFLYHPDFTWIPADVLNTRIIRPKLPENSVIVHLAAISGFPACQNIGRALAHSYNVDAALSVYKLACELHALSFIFPSTYTAFGSQDESKLVSETDPGNPQTLYAETKIEAEKLLLRQVQPCCPLVILRLSDVFGLSPRTRFDLLINQLVWQALNRREISIYQKSYWRSFLHITQNVHC